MNLGKLVLHGVYRAVDSFVLAWARLGHATGMFRLYQPVTDLKLAMDVLDPRVTERLRAISAELPPEAREGIDIGSNVGFYAFELAKGGRRVLAVESSLAEFAILSAAQRKTGNDMVIPVQWRLTPKSIGLLPEADFMIFMSVFHHWCLAFGRDEAVQMLETLVSKTRKVIYFETAQFDETSQTYRDVLPDQGAENSEQWWHDFFRSRKCSDVKTIYKKGRSLLAVRP